MSRLCFSFSIIYTQYTLKEVQAQLRGDPEPPSWKTLLRPHWVTNWTLYEPAVWCQLWTWLQKFARLMELQHYSINNFTWQYVEKENEERDTLKNPDAAQYLVVTRWQKGLGPVPCAFRTPNALILPAVDEPADLWTSSELHGCWNVHTIHIKREVQKKSWVSSEPGPNWLMLFDVNSGLNLGLKVRCSD